MKILLHNFLKNKTKYLIKELGTGINELVLDFNLEIGIFNTIELMNNNLIILHIFKGDLDIITDFDFLEEDDKLLILKKLKKIYKEKNHLEFKLS